MTPVTTTSSRRRLLAGVGGGGALLVGSALVVLGVFGQEPSPPVTEAMPSAPGPTLSAPPTSVTAPSSSVPTATVAPLRPALPESDPVRISIPSIDVDGPFVPLGLIEGGALETPTNATDVGWFTGGHTPGARGVSVVAGHVTYNGPAVFFRLGELTAGAQVEIERSDGSTAVFEVTRSATFPKSEFPSAEVYRPSSSAELVLITCGGEFADAHYDSNVIVWADLVDPLA